MFQQPTSFIKLRTLIWDTTAYLLSLSSSSLCLILSSFIYEVVCVILFGLPIDHPHKKLITSLNKTEYEKKILKFQAVHITFQFKMLRVKSWDLSVFIFLKLTYVKIFDFNYFTNYYKIPESINSVLCCIYCSIFVLKSSMAASFVLLLK